MVNSIANNSCQDIFVMLAKNFPLRLVINDENLEEFMEKLSMQPG